MGKVLFVAMCLQVLLGIGVHWIKVPNHRFMTSSGRGWSNLTHIIIGVFIMAFGWGTVWTGEILSASLVPDPFYLPSISGKRSSRLTRQAWTIGTCPPRAE